jgi:hypothetical protein
VVDVCPFSPPVSITRRQRSYHLCESRPFPSGIVRDKDFHSGTDLSAYRASDLAAVALALNTRPRKTLEWRTPAEALNDLLRSRPTSTVATTG